MQLLYIFFDIQTVLFVVPEDFVLRVVFSSFVLCGLDCVVVMWGKRCVGLCVCVSAVKKQLKFITKFR